MASTTVVTLLPFQSTHPVRGATMRRSFMADHIVHFNPRTPCGVRRVSRLLRKHFAQISIHAPRAGCDMQADDAIKARCIISIHAPRAGCDYRLMRPSQDARHFNPRTPCGVRLRRETLKGGPHHISIHAPRAGCDTTRQTKKEGAEYFNPRTPCGVRLRRELRCSSQWRISIHAPRAGCDYEAAKAANFNAPFQSTHPVRGATINMAQAKTTNSENFNPRTPCGVRRDSRNYD